MKENYTVNSDELVYNDILEDGISIKGRPITCRICDYQFKMKDNEARLIWKASKYECPSCKEIYCDKPKTERILMKLQDEYLLTKNPKVFNEMIIIMKSYCDSLIKKSFSNKIQEIGKLDYYTHTAITFVVEEYLAKDNFKIEASFAGFIIYKIRQAIWGKTEYDIDAESIDFEFEDGNTVTYVDNKKSMIDSINELHSKQKLIDDICNLLFSIEKYCESDYEDYMRILALRNHILSGEFWTDKLFQAQKEDKTGKLRYMQSMELLYKTLQERDLENE